MNWLVIMAGGAGERFWPMSRRRLPKQLLPIVSRKSMLQETVTRHRPVIDYRRMIVITNREQADEVRQQLPRSVSVVTEPTGRNTAPCIGLAAAMIAARDPDGVMAVVPADSWIGDVARYRRVVKQSLAYAGKQEVLITVGIKPSAPHTGYGYIELGNRINQRFWQARRFVEKPDRNTARRYVRSGRYRWNAGMFVWSVRSIQAALAKWQPRIAAGCRRLQGQVDQAGFERALAREFPRLEKISVDYAIMEKADNVVVANGDYPWDDVGDWTALARHLASPDGRNRVRGGFIGLDAAGCVCIGPPGHTIALLGVEDLVVVHTADATLVCRKEDTQRIKQLVQRLGKGKRLGHLL